MEINLIIEDVGETRPLTPEEINNLSEESKELIKRIRKEKEMEG